MRKNIIAGLILLIAILIISSFSGCIAKSAINEINSSALLMNSGKSKLGNIDLTSSMSARVQLDASKADYEEALKILNNATTDYDDEKNIIEIDKISCNYSLDVIATDQNLVTYIEHLNKSSAYMESNDFASARSELKLAEEALNKTTSLISNAKVKIYSIDINTIPVESKSELLENRNLIEKLEKRLTQNGNMISGMNPLIDGLEHAHNASDYIRNEKWNSAGLELNSSSSDLMKARNAFNALKTSEFLEISVASIKTDGTLAQLLEVISHSEAGSKYANQGDFVKANEEFDKANQKQSIVR